MSGTEQLIARANTKIQIARRLLFKNQAEAFRALLRSHRSIVAASPSNRPMWSTPEEPPPLPASTRIAHTSRTSHLPSLAKSPSTPTVPTRRSIFGATPLIIQKLPHRLAPPTIHLRPPTQILIHPFKRSEQPNETAVPPSRSSPLAREVPRRKRSVLSNHRRPHRSVFVRPRRPRLLARYPKCKAHE